MAQIAQAQQPSALGNSTEDNPCHLFAIKQFECANQGGRVECWPFDRIFRQCGKGPSIEVTNRIVSGKDEHPVVDPKFIAHPPKGKKWGERL